MQSIRSLLWIGPAESLARSGVPEAPSLDITWVPNVPASLALPPMTLDAIVVAGNDPGPLLSAVGDLKRRPRETPILARLEAHAPGESLARRDVAPMIRELLGAGVRDVLLAGPEDSPASLRAELLARIDAWRAEPRSLAAREASRDGADPVGVIGSSSPMRDVQALALRAALSRATVLIQGETGTGKELVGRLIHARSDRRTAPYVALNCAAFPESLLESELFGYRKGAFTGAERDRPGHFALAHRGTLFLDEIGETSPALQTKLLRVLQEREVLPVGGSQPRPVDVRVIAATHRDLDKEIRAGRFREDLYYRLAVFPIRLPALRERSGDILELADHFMKKYGAEENKPGCQLSAAARRLLLSHAWPGNVRELENEIQRALALAEAGERIGPRLLSGRVTGLMEAIAQAPHAGETLRATLSSIEAWLIRRALEANSGRRAATARKLGVTREGLYKKMKRLGIAEV